MKYVVIGFVLGSLLVSNVMMRWDRIQEKKNLQQKDTEIHELKERRGTAILLSEIAQRKLQTAFLLAMPPFTIGDKSFVLLTGVFGTTLVAIDEEGVTFPSNERFYIYWDSMLMQPHFVTDQKLRER